jgi:hypothetical protein
MPSLLDVFPNPDDLLALEPEELGGVLLEAVPDVMQNELICIEYLAEPLFRLPVGSYPAGYHRPVSLAIAEAVSWLIGQGLLVQDPRQAAGFLRLTRRAGKLRTRADVEAFRKSSLKNLTASASPRAAARSSGPRSADGPARKPSGGAAIGAYGTGREMPHI